MEQTLIREPVGPTRWVAATSGVAEIAAYYYSAKSFRVASDEVHQSPGNRAESCDCIPLRAAKRPSTCSKTNLSRNSLGFSVRMVCGQKRLGAVVLYDPAIRWWSTFRLKHILPRALN